MFEEDRKQVEYRIVNDNELPPVVITMTEDDEVKVVCCRNGVDDRLVGRYQDVIELKIFSSYLSSLLTSSQVGKLFSLVESGCASVAKISISLKSEPSLVLRTVAFLIKIGFLEKV